MNKKNILYITSLALLVTTIVLDRHEIINEVTSIEVSIKSRVTSLIAKNSFTNQYELPTDGLGLSTHRQLWNSLDPKDKSLYVNNVSNIAKLPIQTRKEDRSLHLGDFSHEQLPETAVNFYPRAFTPTEVEAYASTSSPGGRTLAEIEYAYGIDKITNVYTGVGQTVAIIIPAGSETLVNDLHVFSKQYGLPDAQVSFIYPQGVPTTHSDYWANETSLDAEWVHAIAPNAKIIMVVCNTTAISGLVLGVDAAVNAGAKIVSISWGSVEWSNQLSYDSHFNRSGVTFCIATGDIGTNNASWPSTSPNTLAVGGTLMNVTGPNTFTEDAWKNGGGGVSKYYKRPTWQNGFQVNAMRTTPDVSFNACSYSIYVGNYQGSSGWNTVSGTSASAPIWAALISLGYQNKKTPIASDIHPLLYSNTYTTFFHDITTGINNGVSATVGYDIDTGLGVPNAPALIATLSK